MKHRVLLWVVLAGLFGLLFAEPVAAIGTGSMAPEIGLKDMAGRAVSMRALKGKVVLVDFWASWCAPCREELPVLEALYKKYRGQGFEVVAVNQDQSADNVRKFLNSTPLSFSVVHDRGGSVASRYAPTKMPSSFILDRKGIVRHVHAGFRASERAALDKQIGALVGGK
jgi:cytochrome c biogenesis protein CcmG, thiol:disulfide interchange protein DsbE